MYSSVYSQSVQSTDYRVQNCIHLYKATVYTATEYKQIPECVFTYTRPP